MSAGNVKETPKFDDVVTKDWGSDTLARFRYQAEVTLPYCLAVATGQEDILAVIPEHLEDIAIETAEGWRFVQVKSRNPERGLWRLSDLLAKSSGALRSLYRTYLCTEGEDYPLELALEGACKTNDAIQALKIGHDRSSLVQRVAERLGASRAATEDFLGRVVLNESVPHRSVIHATNARLLHELAPHLNHPELSALHSAFLREIEAAMRCDRLGVLWPRSVTGPERRSNAMSERIRFKTLDRARLTPISEPLSRAGRPLLKRFVESGGRPVSTLEQKMISGGAPNQLIDRAKSLHANARYQHYTRISQNIKSHEDLVEDLHERIITYAHSARVLFETDPRPAVSIWTNLLNKFDSSAANIDRNNLVRADPLLLMGEACVLSDECEFDWGEASGGS